jgi:hypothetical protein
VRHVPDVLAVQEALGRFRLRVGVVRRAGERDQARDLVLAPLRGSRATSLPFGTTLVATAIDLDGHHARRVGNLGVEFAEPVRFGARVSLGNQLRPDGFGQSSDVTPANRNVRQEPERSGGQLERREHRPGVNDLGEHRRAVPVRVKFEVGSLGGKSPGDRRGSGRPVLGA